ncbi:uncharacterized protein LOC130897065 [Diorhabda carinulata]|uniref:uncharacterized protein LOC130441251 n=1 Tax=Diorhabda sublineata TaxID=1163346 RepID=UPI0024E11B3A|nr:uncharacterized protein LOC130441251 [Diorhabda sublineata]XP_057661616.1 uncharacterized protein LOC130897065 [Diorhabda carinulata]
MLVRGCVNVLFITSVVHLAYSRSYPSLYSVPRALTTIAVSASSSASSPTSARFTNIADYRRKEGKAQELEAEKQLSEDHEIEENPNEKDKNEANPTFLQKKINKILTKLQFISSFVAPPEPEENNSTEVSTEEIPRSEVKIDLKQPDFFKSKTPFQNLISQQYGTPLKINLDIQDSESSTEFENFDDVNCTSQENNKIGQAGIHFAELFGSFLALVYGAFAHINKVIQGEYQPETTI